MEGQKGAHNLARKIQAVISSRFSFVLALLLVLVWFPAPNAYAIPPLDQVRDTVGTIAGGEPDVGHDINFTLPLDAQQVVPTDYIIIDLLNYSSVQTATDVIGGYGTPVFGLSGNKVLISGISLLPGTALNVRGVSATNPVDGASIEIVISVADDAAGVTIRNQSRTVPLPQGGFVSVSASVVSTLSALSVSGYTSPSSFVTMTENSSVIGTTVASGTGFFFFPITGLDPGAHTYAIFSSDTSGRSTSTNTLSLFLVASAVTTVTGLLLSPSLELTDNEIDPGDPLTVLGRAKPDSQINILLEGPLRSYNTTSDSNGDWSYLLTTTETATFAPGQYQVYANAQDNASTQSIASPTANFTVLSPDSDNPAPNCNISHGDLNCDNVTNLIDFSILLFHWNTNHRVADINSDSKVNLTDFSIMMFYFNR